MSLDTLVDSSIITNGSLSTESSSIIMSNPPQADNQLKTQIIEAENLDKLKEIFATTGLAVKSENNQENTNISVDNIPSSPEELTEEHLGNLENITRSFLNGDSDIDDSIKQLVAKTHGSTSIQAYVAQDIVVTPANPWIISGQGPVVVKVDKVTVQRGGQIKVLTDASITIAELIKQ